MACTSNSSAFKGYLFQNKLMMRVSFLLTLFVVEQIPGAPRKHVQCAALGALRAKPQWPNQDNVIADNYLSLRPACVCLILHVQITNGPPSISLIYVPTSRMRNYTGSQSSLAPLCIYIYKRTRVSESVCVYKLGTGLLLQNLYPPPQLLWSRH